MQILDEKAKEKGTFFVRSAFTDEDKIAAVPNVGSLTWTLSDARGSVINSRLNQAITSASTITIVLSGADLAVSNPDDLLRVVTIQGTYNSSLGNNLTLKDEVGFYIDDLLVVT